MTDPSRRIDGLEAARLLYGPPPEPITLGEIVGTGDDDRPTDDRAERTEGDDE